MLLGKARLAISSHLGFFFRLRGHSKMKMKPGDGRTSWKLHMKFRAFSHRDLHNDGEALQRIGKPYWVFWSKRGHVINEWMYKLHINRGSHWRHIYWLEFPLAYILLCNIDWFSAWICCNNEMHPPSLSLILDAFVEATFLPTQLKYSNCRASSPHFLQI